MFHGRAWRAEQFGPPSDVLRFQDTTWDAPTDGRMLVKVRACGVGLPDLLMTQGRYVSVPRPPVYPGQEVCGDVVATGPDSRFAVGDRVMGLTPFTEGHGGFSDYAYVRESKAVPAPSTLTDVEAAGFMIGYRTANAALIDRIQLQAGQTVAVLGAAGSSGLAAIALAKALGARVIAIASSAEKLAFCQELGADHGIDYTSTDVGVELKRLTDGVGVDVLFDPVGGPVAAQSLAGVRMRGQVAVIGYASGTWLEVNPVDLVLRNYSVVGVFAGGFTETQDIAANQNLHALAEQGRIRTALGSVHDLEQAPDVLESLEGAVRPGKVVMTVSTDPTTKEH
jgi:NADPH:quinone reductase